MQKPKRLKAYEVVPPDWTGSHYNNEKFYWGLLRDGSVEVIPSSLRNCEVGVVRGASTLCEVMPGIPAHPECTRCAYRLTPDCKK